MIHGPTCGKLGPADLAPLGINNEGQICGRFSSCSNPSLQLPFVWTPARGLIALPLPSGATSGEAVGISDALGTDGIGQLACTFNGSALGGQRAFVYDDGVWTEVPPINGGFHSGAAAMSSNGIVTGYRDVGFVRYAFRLQSGRIDQVAPPDGMQAIPTCVATNGAIAGYLVSTTNHAFRWDGALIEDLDSVVPGGDHAIAVSINDFGEVAGNTGFPPSEGFPFGRNLAWIWRDGKVTTFENLDESRATQLLAMNELGQVVVASFDPQSASDEEIYLWQHGQATPIEALYEADPNLLLAGPVSMNGHGQITCSFFVMDQHRFVGAILSPINQTIGDVNCDCRTDLHDLLRVLGDWGPCSVPGHCVSDIVTSATFQPPGDGIVDGADLAVVLGHWNE